MIRALFYILILANFTLFAWYAWIKSPDTNEGRVLNENVPKILLLSESGKASISKQDAKSSQSSDGACLALGPYTSAEEQREAREWLATIGIRGFEREETSQEISGYWVHLPQEPTREQAIAKVEKLRAQGVSDIYVETDEDKKNIISLGFYHKREAAKRREEGLWEFGLAPFVKAREREVMYYWVDFSNSESFEEASSQLGDSKGRIVRSSPSTHCKK